MKGAFLREPLRRRLAGAFVAAITAFAALPAVAGGRVVAVGDVHGTVEGLTTILGAAGLVDAGGNWCGGAATLVQMGDLLDRGEHVRAVMDLLRGLQPQARAAGGEVVVLLGNHEAMNLLGIRRDLNPAAYAAFADQRSERRRDAAFKAFKRFWTSRARRLGLAVDISADTRDKWMAMHPPGFMEYSEALGPDGEYGRWLRQLPVAVVIGGTLFVHGGYGPQVSGITIAEVNRRVAGEIHRFDELRALMVEEGLALPWYSVMDLAHEARREIDAVDSAGPGAPRADSERATTAHRLQVILDWQSWLLTDPDGPLWWRGAAAWEDTPEQDAEMMALLEGLGVQRMVVGHTPEKDGRIHVRFAGRVFLIDTGMLGGEVYTGGRPSALELVGDRARAIYTDGTVPLTGNAATAAPVTAAAPAAPTPAP